MPATSAVPGTPAAAVRCADVTDDDALTWALAGADTAFVDPARRDPHGARDAAGGRALPERDPGRWSPPWPWVVALADRRPRTVAKVAPGIPRDLAPPDAETAWVSVDGTLVEAVVWFAGLADPTVRRRAVVLRAGHPDAELTSPLPYSSDGPPHAAAGGIGAWLVEPDDAVTRAGLVTDLADLVAGWLIHPRLALVTTAARPQTPLGRVWRVLDVLPDETRSLRAALRARGVTSVTVKTRGVSATPESVRRALRLGGGRDEAGRGGRRGDGDHATVLLTRTPAGGRALLLAAADRET